MSAADRLQDLERRATHSRVVGVALVAIAVLTLLGATFHAGRRAGVEQASAEHYRVLRDTIVDSIKVVEQRIRVDTVRVRVAETKAVAARASFDSAAAAVEAIADTAAVVPTSLVVPEIQTCRNMRDALLEQIDVLKVNVADADLDTDLQTRRADLAEQQLATQHHRFGFRSGLVAGAALVVTVLHFAR